MLEHVDCMRNTEGRTITQAIVVYLFWLKTGVDQTTISVIFGIKGQPDVSRYLAQAREGLSSFVKNHIGPNALTRTQWIQCNTNIAIELFVDKKPDEPVEININESNPIM